MYSNGQTTQFVAQSSKLNNFNYRVSIYVVRMFESCPSSFQSRCSSFKLVVQVSSEENKETKNLSLIYCLSLLFKLSIPIAMYGEIDLQTCFKGLETGN